MGMKSFVNGFMFAGYTLAQRQLRQTLHFYNQHKERIS